MRIQLISVGQRLPDWVNTGCETYARRLPDECRLQLIEIAAGKRSKNADIQRITRDEGQRMLKAVARRTHIVALDVGGKSWTTEQLAQQLQKWMASGQDLALLVGGPEGLSADCLQAARERWSLSPLTFPHPLVRVIVAEQLFRAWSILRNHPYHRGG
ncbi:MAG: 23S rRNA (pseudouridine(1915)-N(3))-methyltransferase RlmH [gamma proteobacterium symbiont of Bathyaustriella thionipta]|nr:23S rRNA (pseudouridine(1915)-N(3))-methyltransferase RlmH [gamma proteobacterium symbiont of Bathyaustriella thionipta]